MEIFEQDVEENVFKLDESPNFNNIIQRFVTTTEELKAAWITTKNDNNNICKRFIPFGQLSFKCYTCLSNSSYQYCDLCFDPSLHLNHKCLTIYDEGICICGNETILSQRKFLCQKHGDLILSDRQKIPEQLQHNIKQIILAIFKGYLKYMRLIKQQLYNYDIAVMRIYNFSQIFNIQPIYSVIPDKHKIDIYMNYFDKAIILLQTMFRFFFWLVDQQYQLIFLITQIFKENLSQDSNQTILEDLFEYQIIVESQQPFFYIRKIQNPFQILFEDLNFKLYFQSIYLKNYKQLWFIYPHQGSQTLLNICNNIMNLKNSTKQFQIEIANNLMKYIEESQFQTDLSNEFYFLNLMSNHFLDEQLQIKFVEDKNFQNINKYNTEFWNKIQTWKTVPNIQLFGEETVRKNLEYLMPYRWSEQVLLNQLWKCLGAHSSNFQNQKADWTLLQDFKFSDYIFTAFIESFAEIKPIKISLTDEELIKSVNHYIDAKIYLQLLGTALFNIQIGLSDIFQSEQISNHARQNLAQLILLRSYNIIKEQRNKHINIDEELNLAYERLVQGQNQNQLIERLEKIYLLLLKSSTFVDKVFTLMLCYIFTLEKFENPVLFQVYLKNILQDEIDVLNLELKQILSRCIQNQISVYFCSNLNVKNIYQYPEREHQIAILESFDLAFIKIYIFLFGFGAFQEIKQIINAKHLPENELVDDVVHLDNSKYESILLLNLLGSDICIYNVCGHMFEELTENLKLSLTKSICSIFYLYQSFSYEDLKELFQKFGIQVNKYTANHVRQVCKLNPFKNHLELKSQFIKPIYDPALLFFCDDKFKKKKILTTLNDKNESEIMICYGNGIQWDIERFSQGSFRLLLYNHLKFYSQPTFMINNSKRLMEERFSPQLCQLLFIQVVAANYFIKPIFQRTANTILINLETLMKKLIGNQEKNYIRQLMNVILSLKGNQIKLDRVPLKSQLKNHFLFQQAKLRVQYKNKQKQFQNFMPLINQLLPMPDQQNLLCSICKTSLYLEEACALVHLFPKAKSNFLSLPQLQFHQIECNIGLKNCEHFYHQKCLEFYFTCFKDNQENDKKCPNCRQKFTTTLPIILKSQSNLYIDVDQFQTNILVFLLESNHIKNHFDDEVICNSMFILLYYSFIFDLVCNLLHDPKEFKRLKKFIIFQQLIKLLRRTAEVKKNKEEVIFEPSKITIYQLLLIVQRWIFFEKNYNQFQKAAAQWLISLNLSDIQIKQQFCACFDIPENIEEQQVQKMQKQDNVDPFFIMQIQLNSQIQEKIIKSLGKNFEEFYFRYFPQKCHFCNTYRVKSQFKCLTFVCLLCLKSFCGDCTSQNEGCRNRFLHSVLIHEGESIYIILQNGCILLCESDIQQYIRLFQNDLGENIDIYVNTNWSEYVISLHEVEKLANIIIHNQFTNKQSDQVISSFFYVKKI